jgi:hypothetical protein
MILRTTCLPNAYTIRQSLFIATQVTHMPVVCGKHCAYHTDTIHEPYTYHMHTICENCVKKPDTIYADCKPKFTSITQVICETLWVVNAPHNFLHTMCENGIYTIKAVNYSIGMHVESIFSHSLHMITVRVPCVYHIRMCTISSTPLCLPLPLVPGQPLPIFLPVPLVISNLPLPLSPSHLLPSSQPSSAPHSVSAPRLASTLNCSTAGPVAGPNQQVALCVRIRCVPDA